jgi:hypothetical protein
VIVSRPTTLTEESVQKKKKAEKVDFYLRHNKSKKKNLNQVFSKSRSGTIAHQNKKNNYGSHSLAAYQNFIFFAKFWTNIVFP